jgi:hypothetical protein
MTRVFSHPDPAITHLVLNRLEQLGVDAVIQGEANGRGMGEVPPIAAWSEVWVADGASLADVEAAVAEVTAEPEATPASWTCPTCDEVVDGQFSVCWACGTFAPDAA